MVLNVSSNSEIVIDISLPPPDIISFTILSIKEKKKSEVSKVWSYADRIDKNSVKCKQCEAILTAKGGNTITIRHHLTRTHYIDIDCIRSLGTPNILSFFTALRPKMTKEGKLILDQKIADFVARDAHPISLVEGDGFFSLLKYTDPDYTQECPERHTRENISICLQDAANEWQIPVQKIAATAHGNSSNINRAMDFLNEWPDQRCFAHTLQLAVGAGLKLPAIANMIRAARQLAAHFKRSNLAMQELRNKQAALRSKDDEKTFEVIIDCSTRWKPTLDMFERLVKLRWVIGAVLSDQNFTTKRHASILQMTEENWLLAQAIIPILKPLKQVTAMSSGQKYPLLSLVYPLLSIVLKNVRAAKPDECTAANNCKNVIATEITKRYYLEGFSVLPGPRASVLDPRYKFLKFCEVPIRNETYSAIRAEMEAIVMSVLEENLEVVAEEPMPKRARDHLEPGLPKEKVFDELALLCTANEEFGQIDELASFLSETPLTVSGNILEFWQNNTKRYPKLSILARKYMCIPATSVPAKCAFSSAENVVNRRRASLAPETVDILVFLYRNWELCNLKT
ncbi:E3 SUMO-protein ligase ZBED1-like [Hydra vulgaris]|uniref:E3 SUMO-protein ligase ZBED1-like n=1 Tax=Hydra vulgaris TaxID=6087 RepID=A0ABM4BUL3_HYDVU